MPKLTMDWHDNPPMKRGDWLVFPKSRYIVLDARQVKRRDPNACVRFKVWCEREDVLSETRPRLLQMLIRHASQRDGGRCYHCAWNTRKKKAQTFEQLMRRTPCK